MKRFAYFAPLFLLQLAIAVSALAQENQPAVSLNESEKTPPSVQVPQENTQEVNLPIQDEPDGSYLVFTDLLEALRSIDPKSRGEWDGQAGVARVHAAGQELQALSNRPLLLINGEAHAVAKPLGVRGGSVLVPLESVKILFKAVGFDLEVNESNPAEPSPIHAAKLEPSTTSPKPSEPSDESPDAGDQRGSAAMLPQGSLISPVGERSLPPLEIPKTVKAGETGLTWKQLADAAHNRPPRRLTLVCDPQLQTLALRLQQFASSAMDLQVAVVSAEDRRSGVQLLSQIAKTQPDLVLDLIHAPSAGKEVPDGSAAIEIWSVHDALWPGDGNGESAGAKKEKPLAYKTHQFQNLALGSMLRGELVRSFPNRPIQFELAPSYLLRRMDAPCAAALIPPRAAGSERDSTDRIARALAAGLIAYCRGMESATAP